jgi:hypothetical protein
MTFVISLFREATKRSLNFAPVVDWADLATSGTRALE